MKTFDLSEFDNTIYHDAQRYDNEHWWKTDDIEFWQKILKESDSQSVLELASGTGRLAIPLLQSGADYTGIEISPEFCERAISKLKEFRNRVHIQQGDIRNFDFDKKFDLIFIGFNSFLHLLTDDDAMACLQCVKKHLHENSRFLIDIFIPNPLFLYRPEGIRFPTMEYKDAITGEQIQVEETNEYDPKTEINKILWYYSTPTKRDISVYKFSMRMYFPDTMNRLLIDAGFQIENLWGDYDRSKFDETSHLQIYDCRYYPG